MDPHSLSPSNPENQIIITNSSHTKRNIVIACVCFMIMGGLLAVLIHRQIIRIGVPFINQKSPTASVKSIGINKPPDNPNLENCFIQKEGNPLVSTVLQDPTMIYGEINGNLNTITFDSDTSARLEIISFKGEQMHTYTLHYQEGLVYDGQALKNVPLKSLQKGQVITISFNCFPKLPEEKQFKIARVVINQRR